MWTTATCRRTRGPSRWIVLVGVPVLYMLPVRLPLWKFTVEFGYFEKLRTQRRSVDKSFKVSKKYASTVQSILDATVSQARLACRWDVKNKQRLCGLGFPAISGSNRYNSWRSCQRAVRRFVRCLLKHIYIYIYILNCLHQLSRNF